MKRVIWSAVIVCLSCASLSAQQPYTFRNLPSDLNIELQPQSDHHRIHFRVKIDGLAGKSAFAKIAVSEEVNGRIHSETAEVFDVTAESEVWEFYLRVPRFSSRTAVYTLVLGEFDPEQVDQYQAKVGYRWIINRDPSGRALITTEEEGKPLAVMFPVRTAHIIGGEIKIVSEVKLTQPEGIRFGQVGPGGAVDGTRSAQRVN